MKIASGAGVNYSYKMIPELGHDFSYVKHEVPAIIDFMNHHPRNPAPNKIVWETDDPKRGKYHWISIDAIGNDQYAEWHKDYNLEISEDKVELGFSPDITYEGAGVKILSLLSDYNFCTAFGL